MTLGYRIVAAAEISILDQVNTVISINESRANRQNISDKAEIQHLSEK